MDLNYVTGITGPDKYFMVAFKFWKICRVLFRNQSWWFSYLWL